MPNLLRFVGKNRFVHFNRNVIACCDRADQGSMNAEERGSAKVGAGTSLVGRRKVPRARLSALY